ncbi:chromatin modification-related protein EAF1 A-like isoform X2 [Trifolium pratense]|uniref:chromatin modification-related protein EAF1 A-like isoform X2 n=1 Tax=Trifolium pratense TaxID=57577 RepID=UPI001E6974C8|nr:chromatin modification-related protein EAF1 A-like isoform X2 [Trifolium pratense]
MGSEALRWAGRHGCNSGSAHVSPCQVAIEKAQAELRQEYDVREERRRQLEFLEKGGNPLDFKLGNAVAVSVQSTSLTDQRQEQFVTSEAKGSFVLTASPHGDSVDSCARPGAPSFDPESCCAQTSLARDVNNDTVMRTHTKNADANGTAFEQTIFEKKLSSTASEAVKERSKTNIGENGTTTKNEHAAGYVNYSGSGSIIKNEEDFHMNSSSMQNKLKDSSSIRGHHNNDCTVTKADKGESVVMMDRSNSTKQKRIMELSAPILPSPILRKCPWDFVLEEMAWLANDFAQERLWKTTAASVLANAVMQFWDSVELLLDKDIADHEKVDSSESSRDKRKNSEMESSNCMEGQNARKIFGLKVHFYAMRYIMDRRSHEISSQTEGPASPDKISDSGTVDMSRVENLTENSRCAKYRLPDVHEKEKPTTSGQHAGGNDAGFEVGERSSTDKCCNICWKGVEEIVKYGLFPNCDHLFCHGCISRWRCNGSACWKIMKSCPTCRAFSFFVIPSTKWLAGDAKATYIKNYMQRCSSIDCRYFLHGDGYCPQRHHCFYRHVVHPGTYRWMHHRSPPPPQPEVDEEVAADTITGDDDLSDDDYYQYDDDSQPDSYS